MGDQIINNSGDGNSFYQLQHVKNVTFNNNGGRTFQTNTLSAKVTRVRPVMLLLSAVVPGWISWVGLYADYITISEYSKTHGPIATITTLGRLSYAIPSVGYNIPFIAAPLPFFGHTLSLGLQIVIYLFTVGAAVQLVGNAWLFSRRRFVVVPFLKNRVLVRVGRAFGLLRVEPLCDKCHRPMALKRTLGFQLWANCTRYRAHSAPYDESGYVGDLERSIASGE
uniref:Uncharacterized protein n=1 Tax=mine drainage metagenome TaxID=410659 RepID=E6PH01_9ZZZZ